jgi:asparagine synthase (glutamine-hydrolysing)
VRPLFYTFHQNRLLFGSEVKALLAAGVRVELSPEALDQVFTYWSVQAPRTIFENVQQLPPGHYLLARHGRLTFRPYWTLDFSRQASTHSPGEYQAELEELLIDATRLRLRADVPVGAYLSGGLDSAITAAIVRQHAGVTLETFSIAFSNPEFDESESQQTMARELGTQHHVVTATHKDIGRVFPDVIWHIETPLLRTAPAPMFLLSRLVHQHGLKVVLTGEGADEFLGGYDIFKEMKVRRFWARDPDSTIRPLLLRKLYRDIAALGQTNQAFLIAFFKRDLEQTASPYYSHLIRWNNAARLRRSFLNLHGPAITGELRPELPAGFDAWEPLAQAQYLEAATFLSPYLLASQGDRVAMAHSVEGRFPFLDYRVVQFCTRLPANLKLRGLTEKWLLKQIGRKLLPESIWQRRKRPYRAPIQRSFCYAGSSDYVRDLMSEEAVRRAEVFNPTAVAQLARKAHSAARLSEVEEMALVGVLSTQLVHHHFVEHFRAPAPAEDIPLKTVDRLSVPESEVSYAG